MKKRAFRITCALTAFGLGAAAALLGICGPFTDVSDAAFCPFVLEIFSLGITTGTTPTTYDPASSVSRLQMAAFLSRTVDRVLQRASPRAARSQFWTPQATINLGITTFPSGSFPGAVKFDGRDLWVTIEAGVCATHRVRASDGRILETWTGCGIDEHIAMNKVFLTGSGSQLYRIDPTQAPGAVTTIATNLGTKVTNAQAIAFDGLHIWTAQPFDPSISIVSPSTSLPWTVTTVTTGFAGPLGLIYDGANVWVKDTGTLLKLDTAGGILQTVTIGSSYAGFPIFDGTNIWSPRDTSSVAVVRASTGAVLATLTGNGLFGPTHAAFDGQRVLVTNFNGNSVSIWKAADLTPLGFFPMGTSTEPTWVCSDGVNFWISLSNTQQLARF